MTTDIDYLELSDHEQAEALRPVARAAAEAFGLDPHRLEVHLHAYNTTYALQTATGARFALRINTSSTSSREQITSQQAWQLALTEETPVLVPTPLRTAEGHWCAAVPSPVLGREVLVTCASWLEGPDVDTFSPEVAHALGRAMALLHRQAQSWQLPQDGALPLLDTPLLGEPDRLARADLDAGQHAVLDQARSRCAEAFARVHDGAPVIALHADLHGGNLKWQDGRLAIFDFDDCGLGVPALDLAISTFYLRGGAPGAEDGLRAGYASVAPLPDLAPECLETLIASRQLLLANHIMASTTAQFRQLAHTYVPTAVARLQHWLDTGHFTRELATG